MFAIYGGHTEFTQWLQNQKLIMKELPVGADVQFYQDPTEDDPLITEVYEFVDESGSTIKVCDVPNIFLTNTLKIKACVDAKVYGAFGNAFNVVGNREKIFKVNAAEKPVDYVYEETPTKGCGCDHHDSPGGGSVSEEIATDEEVENALNDIFGPA